MAVDLYNAGQQAQEGRSRLWSIPGHPASQVAAAAALGLGLGVYTVVVSGVQSRFGPMLIVGLLGALAGVAIGRPRRTLLAVVLLGIPFRVETHLDYHLAEAQLGAIGGLGVSTTTLCLLLLYAIWFGELLLQRGENQPRFRPGIPLYLYLGGTLISVLVAIERSLSVFEIAMLVQTLFLFIYLVSNVRTRDDFLFVVSLLVGGMLLEGLVVLATFGLHHDLHVAGIHTRTDSVVNGQAVSPRYGGTIGGPNGAAAYFELLLPAALALCFRAPSNRLRLLGACAFGVGTLSLLLTQSRGGLLALIVALAVLGLIAVHRGWISPAIPLLGLSAAIAGFLMLKGVLPARFFNQEGTQAADGRWPLLRLALHVIRDHPIFGVGANNFAVVLKDYATPDLSADWLYTVHNKYLLVWSEDGLLAVAGFVLFLLATVRRGLRASALRDPVLAALAAGLTAAVAGHMVHMGLDIFNDRTSVEELWTIAALLASATSLVDPRPGPSSPDAKPRPTPGAGRLARPALRPIPLHKTAPRTVGVRARVELQRGVDARPRPWPTSLAPAFGSSLPASFPAVPPPPGAARGPSYERALAGDEPHGWRVIASNAGAMLASDVVNRAVTFALYTLVARRLGADQFGELSLALTLVYTFQILAVAGLKSLVVREVARDGSRASLALVNASAVVLATSLMAIVLARGFARLMGYAPDTTQVILLLSLGLVPYALSSIAEAVLQGFERMRPIAAVNIPVNLLKVGLAFLAIARGGGLVQLALLLLLGQTLSLSLEWVFLWRSVVRPRLTLDLGFCGRLLRSTLTFLGIDGIIAITSSVNVVLLSRFRTESEVGFYNAATQFLVPVALVLQSLVIGAVPAMCRRFGLTGESLSELTAPIVELMLALALPMAAGLCFLAAPAVSLLYGRGRLDPAVPALEVLAWGLIATALTSILGQVLVASLRERVALRIVLVDLAVSVVAGILLIPAFGFVGAAMAGLVTRVVDMTLHYLPVAREYPLYLLVQASWKPVLATAVMGAYLTVAPARGLLIDVPAAAAIYLVTFALLLLAESGSPRRVKLHYALAWRNL